VLQCQRYVNAVHGAHLCLATHDEHANANYLTQEVRKGKGRRTGEGGQGRGGRRLGRGRVGEEKRKKDSGEGKGRES
jgi:hypothetical protein